MDWLPTTILLLFLFCSVGVAIHEWWTRRCPFCQAARAAFSKAYPDWKAIKGWHNHRAVESNRVVVAVFYSEPKIGVRPPPYRLFAVSRDFTSVEELPRDANSPYLLHGLR
jgi:hypothetical protein